MKHTEDPSIERTVAILKPDAVGMGGWCIGSILMDAAHAGLKPVAMWMGQLDKATWETFYEEHKQKDFWYELIRFMMSGPSVFVVFEGPDAIARWRDLIGPSNPARAHPGDIRRKWGSMGPANAVHGSDSRTAAEREAVLLFPAYYRGAPAALDQPSAP